MKLVQYNEYLVTSVAADGLVLLHVGISSYSAEYAPTHFSCLWVIDLNKWLNEQWDIVPFSIDILVMYFCWFHVMI